MKTFAILLLLATGVRGFGVLPLGSSVHSSTYLPSTSESEAVSYFEDWVEAIDCASQFGECDIDKLRTLADKVQAGDDCTFESSEANQEACDKERADRQRVADMLRLQAHLQEQMDDLEVVNAFARSVRDEQNIRERDMEIELLSEDAL